MYVFVSAYAICIYSYNKVSLALLARRCSCLVALAIDFCSVLRFGYRLSIVAFTVPVGIIVVL